MLPILEKRIRIMTICARLELVAFLVGMVSLGCFLPGFFAEGIWIPFAILTMICFSIIAGCTLYPKQLSEKSDLSPYTIPIYATDFESICVLLTASPIDEDGWISFRKIKKLSVRLLIQHCQQFNKKDLSSRRKTLNRQINLRFSVRQDGPADAVLKRLRVNLVVCQHSSDAAISWVGRDSVRLLSRNEAIINAVICLQTQELLFPACLDSLALGEVEKYRTAAELLINALTDRVEK